MMWLPKVNGGVMVGESVLTMLLKSVGALAGCSMLRRFRSSAQMRDCVVEWLRASGSGVTYSSSSSSSLSSLLNSFSLSPLLSSYSLAQTQGTPSSHHLSHQYPEACYVGRSKWGKLCQARLFRGYIFLSWEYTNTLQNAIRAFYVFF